MGGSEGAEQLLNQLAAFALVINIFLLPLFLFIEWTLSPCFGKGTLDPSFLYTIVPFSLTCLWIHGFANLTNLFGNTPHL
jgi:hypothetical protein